MTVRDQEEKTAFDLTEAVVRSFDGASDPRFRQVMQSLVRHIHAFALEVELTEAEWFAAIDFLTATGQISDDRRQEFVLLSDTLGLSMRTVGLNQAAGTAATEPTVFGPFFREGSPRIEQGGDLAQGAQGEPCWVQGTVSDIDGTPVAGALVEVWQADGEGFYDLQYEGVDVAQGRGNLLTDERGGFGFWTVRPVAYPIPADGPVGRMLTAAGRSPMRPAHIHFTVSAEGHRRLITHVFDQADPVLPDDAVFGVRESLMAPFEEHEPGPAPAGREMDQPWFSLEFDFALAKEER